MAETSLVYLHEVKAWKEQQAWGVHWSCRKGRSTTTWPKVTTGNRVGFFTAGHSDTQQPTWSQISRINKFANQAQKLSVGTAIWTESWAFDNCLVAFCYWSALSSSSLALGLFFLCSPWFSDNISLCFSLSPLLSLATNQCSRAREKETYSTASPGSGRRC